MKKLLLADTSSLHSRRGLGQRVAYGFALAFYLCAALCVAGFLLWYGELGGEHPVIASLGASLVFFIGAGIVLVGGGWLLESARRRLLQTMTPPAPGEREAAP